MDQINCWPNGACYPTIVNVEIGFAAALLIAVTIFIAAYWINR